MNIFEAVFLGIIEGVTEFLPVSSTGHLTIAEKLLGFKINDPDITAFTAIIQIGAVLATVVYFRKEIWDIITGWINGVTNKTSRTTQEYKLGWGIIIGSIPIAVIGLLFKDQVESTLRSLWYIGFALLLWSVVMYAADLYAKQFKHEKDITWKDTLLIGLAQCIALVPGVSRSGATMSAGLFRDFDRVTVTKLSFFLSIPALLAAGLLQSVTEASAISNGVGWGPTIIATIVSFFVAYAAVAWLLKFVAKHTFKAFIVYRVALGIVILLLLATNTISAT
ncbi:MAG: undecaprenyl-diphosphate phosphatase [Patescibacteria group bacterium]|nr:undecaprenyl-diphosphate phosphatase [Patescibacteria group bacterium]